MLSNKNHHHSPVKVITKLFDYITDTCNVIQAEILSIDDLKWKSSFLDSSGPLSIGITL